MPLHVTSSYWVCLSFQVVPQFAVVSRLGRQKSAIVSGFGVALGLEMFRIWSG